MKISLIKPYEKNANCTKCGRPIVKMRLRKDASCQDCVLARIRADYYRNRDAKIQAVHDYRKNNAEAIRVARKLKYLLDREKILALAKEYYSANHEKVLERVAAYRMANPERIRERNINRKALLRLLMTEGRLPSRWIENLLRKTKKCPLCKSPMTDGPGQWQKHVDHIIPIGKGGKHTKLNLRVICRTCNLKRPKDGRDLK